MSERITYTIELVCVNCGASNHGAVIPFGFPVAEFKQECYRCGTKDWEKAQ